MERIHAFVNDIKRAGYQPTKVVLFGSYANGGVRQESDIDLAIWDDRFTGCGTIDIEPIKSIISKYPLIELHSFSTGEDDKHNPFAREILRTGVQIE